MLPQVGQGALAVECREDDDDAAGAASRRIEHEPTRRCVDAERAFLAELGGDCSLPAGAHAVAAGSGLRLEAFVAAVDGPSMLREAQEGPDHTVGTLVARRLLERGGDGLLGR